MREEADGLDVPLPRVEAIILEGRRERRRRRVLPALAGVAAAAVAGALLVPHLVDDPAPSGESVTAHERADAAFSGAEAAAAADAYARGGAFAAGSRLYFGGSGEFGVPIDDPAVKSVYYTSAGVLVRHGTDYAMDDASRDGYSLVRTDGSITGLDLHLGDVSASTDPTQPLLAYARPGRGSGDWDVVVLDLESGEPVATVPVDGAFTWGGWDAPPVALEGDRVYLGLDDAMLAVDWHTGETTTTPLPTSTYPEINGDRYLSIDNGVSDDGTGLDASVRVRDALTGETLLDLPDVGDRFASLSPDGEQVLVLPYLPVGDDGQVQEVPGAVLYTVATGEETTIPASPLGGYGWTPDGLVFSVAGDSTTLCEAGSGCTTTPLDLDLSDGEVGTLRLGGMVNES
ncbi:hypothetical protein C7S10_10765 [Nocardioides currus]|uniref:Uncharacterized protein n=2 Tax=Nocardioides currus TaxID=2133958 RepID=A0A2R7YWV4_9ACTN|nr:hypothetical protein C7S10_10765 [Nocardioides currus]